MTRVSQSLGPRSRHLRRRQSGRQRRAVAARDADRATRCRVVDQRDGASRRSCWWRVTGPQGVDVDEHDPGRRLPHRSRRHVARRSDRGGGVASGDGTVDARHVPASVLVRSRPPTRSGQRRRPPTRLGGDVVGAGWVGDRCRLDDLRGGRQAQAGRRLRLHACPRLPPAAGDDRRHRARSCTVDSARVRPTPSAARNGSSTSWWLGLDATTSIAS